MMHDISNYGRKNVKKACRGTAQKKKLRHTRASCSCIKKLRFRSWFWSSKVKSQWVSYHCRCSFWLMSTKSSMTIRGCRFVCKKQAKSKLFVYVSIQAKWNSLAALGCTKTGKREKNVGITISNFGMSTKKRQCNVEINGAKNENLVEK